MISVTSIDSLNLIIIKLFNVKKNQLNHANIIPFSNDLLLFLNNPCRDLIILT